MSSVFETAKSATSAYNDKNWNALNAVFAENGVYDEKATSRRVQGVGKIIKIWQGWATAIPDSKGDVCRRVRERRYGHHRGRLEGYADGLTANGDGHHPAVE